MTTLSAFSLFNIQDPPHRHYILAKCDKVNAHGVVTHYAVVTNHPHTAWWIKASSDVWRRSPGMRTSSQKKAEQWIRDVQNGDVTIAEVAE